MTIRVNQGHLFKMPAGEWHVQNPKGFHGICIATVCGAFPSDLIAMSVWADAVHRDGATPVLLIPYLPGARQDRRQVGEALSAKVYADLINACNFEQVICVDPHSDVMPALIDRLKIITADRIVEHILSQVPFHFQGFIAPDAGASKKVWTVSQRLDRPMYQALKHRDMGTGKLSGFTCEQLPQDAGMFLLVDDICDGGGTFMGLASYLEEEQNIGREKLALCVTHGAFTGDNAKNLAKYFRAIFTTDSYPGGASARYDTDFVEVLTVVGIRNLMMEELIA